MKINAMELKKKKMKELKRKKGKWVNLWKKYK